MRRGLVILAFLLAPLAAHAACTPTAATAGMIGCEPQASSMSDTDWLQVWLPGVFPQSAQIIQRQNMLNGTVINPAQVGPMFFASNYGVKADGTTSDDVALAAAVTACSAVGGSLVLPYGKILLTGAATISLKSCSLVGVGVTGIANGSNASYGTTILLTSTTTKPFVCAANWSISGVNFFWPNQTTGTTVYPSLISDNGSVGCGFFHLDHIAILNAYDGVTQTARGPSWGNFFISNSDLWAVHDLFRLNTIGDSAHITGNHFTPGNWLNECSFACQGAVNAGIAVNSLLHVNAGAPVTLTLGPGATFGWRYGILIDSGGQFSSSEVDLIFDGMGTLVDSSSGGLYTVQNTFNGSVAGCGVTVVYGGTNTGNYPCFNLGVASGLVLNGFYDAANRGSFIVGGGILSINNVHSDDVGGANDGGDYYQIDGTGTAGQWLITGNSFGGDAGATTHAHGLSSGSNVPVRAQIQNNSFGDFNDDVNILGSPTTVISGNWSFDTGGASSIIIGGTTNGVTYGLNQWDKPPVATVSSCGAGATVQGGINGSISVGSTVTTTSCSLTLPFSPNGGTGGNCTFWSLSGVPISGGPSGIPPTWVLTFHSDLHSSQVFFNCPGEQ